MPKKVLFFLWVAASLTTMFFYPLVSAMSDDLVYLQWQRTDTYAFCVNFVAIAAVTALLLWWVDSIPNSYGRTVAVVVLIALPFGSFGIQVLRQLLPAEQLAAVAVFVASNLSAQIIVGMLTLVGGVVAVRHHEALRQAITTAALVVSPLCVAAAVTVARAGFLDPTVQITSDRGTQPAETSQTNRNVFVIVFDELDYDFLYEDGKIRSAYPAMRAFSAISENYHEALSPGEATLEAMPGLLMGLDEVPTGSALAGMPPEAVWERGDAAAAASDATDVWQGTVFAAAQREGFRTVMIGWFHPYCQVLRASLDDCRSFSNYNYAAVTDGSTWVSPILTTLILWPHQFPFGLLKNPVKSAHQDMMVQRTYDLAVSTLDSERALFQIVHFSIPHVPFVYDSDGYNPPADPYLQNAENYERQLRYTDKVFGRFIAALEQHRKFSTSDVVLLSDHAYRSLARAGTARRVPLIIKRAGQAARTDVYGPTFTGLILRSFVEDSDPSPGVRSSSAADRKG